MAAETFTFRNDQAPTPTDTDTGKVFLHVSYAHFYKLPVLLMSVDCAFQPCLGTVSH